MDKCSNNHLCESAIMYQHTEMLLFVCAYYGHCVIISIWSSSMVITLLWWWLIDHLDLCDQSTLNVKFVVLIGVLMSKSKKKVFGSNRHQVLPSRDSGWAWFGWSLCHVNWFSSHIKVNLAERHYIKEVLGEYSTISILCTNRQIAIGGHDQSFFFENE